MRKSCIFYFNSKVQKSNCYIRPGPRWTGKTTDLQVMSWRSHWSWSISPPPPPLQIYQGHFVLQLSLALIAPLISMHHQQFMTQFPRDPHLPSVKAGASAVYVMRNLLFFQLRSLLIKESLAFSMFTSSPTQNTSQAAWTRKEHGQEHVC